MRSPPAASGGSDTIGIGTVAAVVSDAGSKWDLQGNPLTVGNAGDGYLTIQNGGTVTSSAAGIGVAVGTNSHRYRYRHRQRFDMGPRHLNDLMIGAVRLGTGSLSINTGGAVKMSMNATVGSNSDIPVVP